MAPVVAKHERPICEIRSILTPLPPQWFVRGT
jgi:hypothetical protein